MMIKYRVPTLLERNKPWKVLKSHWLGSLKILEGEKYTASFIWNRRFLNLLENLGSPGKVIEFLIKLRVGTLAINFIPQKFMVFLEKYTPFYWEGEGSYKRGRQSL